MPVRNKSKSKREALTDSPEEMKALSGLNVLESYRKAKTKLTVEMNANERWWNLSAGIDGAPGQNGAWMFSSIANKHADAMDGVPSAAVLPREESDIEAAAELSEIIPAILGRNNFEKLWSDCWYDKLKHGSAVYGVFWDTTALGSLGDISLRRIDVDDLFWEPGVCDIQESTNVFQLTSCPDETLCAIYPGLKGVLSESGKALSADIYGKERREGRHNVVDRYYKKRINGRNVLHFCRSVCGTVVYASEKDPAYKDRGYYDHGLYPFVFDTLFTRKNSPCGFGLTELLKGSEEQIDKLENALVENTRMAAHRRYFAREACGINEEEFTDWRSPIVHYSGSGDPSDSVMPIDVPALDSACLELLEYKVNELKEISGNRDFNQGGTASGVTAASAIEALQEAGNKLSRDMLRGSYMAFEQVCVFIIELIRQFYTLPRCFRIVGKNGASEFREFDNSAIVARKQGVYGDRIPMFDITVRAIKQSPYTKAAINDLAREFFGAGLFSPERREEALLCLEMMDFDGRDRMIELVRNGGHAG